MEIEVHGDIFSFLQLYNERFELVAFRIELGLWLQKLPIQIFSRS